MSATARNVQPVTANIGKGDSGELVSSRYAVRIGDVDVVLGVHGVLLRSVRKVLASVDLQVDMKANPQPQWSVGELAKRFGLETHVLRHWEDEGLLQPSRDTSGYRRYGPDDVTRVA